MRTFDVVIALPTKDRQRAYAFAQALGCETPGELANDGVPEPLQIAVNERTRVMYVPLGGFRYVTAARATAEPGAVECLLSISVDSAEMVDDLVRAAGEAGAEVVTQPKHVEWGYSGTVADPDGHLWEVLHPGS